MEGGLKILDRLEASLYGTFSGIVKYNNRRVDTMAEVLERKTKGMVGGKKKQIGRRSRRGVCGVDAGSLCRFGWAQGCGPYMVILAVGA